MMAKMIRVWSPASRPPAASPSGQLGHRYRHGTTGAEEGLGRVGGWEGEREGWGGSGRRASPPRVSTASRPPAAPAIAAAAAPSPLPLRCRHRRCRHMPPLPPPPPLSTVSRPARRTRHRCCCRTASAAVTAAAATAATATAVGHHPGEPIHKHRPRRLAPRPHRRSYRTRHRTRQKPRRGVAGREKMPKAQ